jgi:tRNA (guanine-N7-)-methyltransferase
MAKENGFEIIANIENVHAGETVSPALQIKTFYEKQWIARGIPIKYVSFRPNQKQLTEPDVDIEPDTYRSFGRGAVNVD